MRSAAAAVAAARSALALTLACALTGCVDTSEAAREDDPSGGGEIMPGTECQTASDCAPASSTCCECPTFAVPIASGFDDGCAEVDCEPMACPLTETVCDMGRCELACTPILTDMVCETGFERDAFGCLLDACASPQGPASCTGDEDCVEVPADCCGCEHGGADTAVPASQVDEYLASLDCPADPACPGLSSCDPSAAPRCTAGHCELTMSPPDAEDGATPSTPCGTAAAPTCPDGLVCVLNDPDAMDATQVGVGSCQQP